MTKTTKIIISIVVFITLLSFYGYTKAMKLKKIFEQITIKPAGIRNLDISTKRISFNLDIEMTNPTADDFDVSGYFASLKRINVFYKGKYIATASANLNSIEILANNTLKIANIPVIVPTSTALSMAMEFINFSINNLTIEAIIDIAGTEIKIIQ